MEQSSPHPLYAAYAKAHRVCPTCLKQEFLTTTMNWRTDTHNKTIFDPNLVQCPCGWVGIGNDLVLEPVKAETRQE